MDKKKLLKSLNAARVDFVIIGATAFPVHGYSRATLDIDIFIRPTFENAERTLKALRKFGYDTEDLTVEDLLKNKILIRQYVVETDIHPFVKGIDFAEVWANKICDRYEGIAVHFAALDSLIKMKKAAGRPKDLEDLKILRKLKKKRSPLPTS